MIPQWLHIIALVSLVTSGLCALVIAVDVARHPQQMWIMNVVWPASALFGGVILVWAYFRYGRLATRAKAKAAKARDEALPAKKLTPFPVMVGKGTMHCGSGCTLGDICAEWLVYLAPVVVTWAGWKVLFADKIFAAWIVDYVFAFGFGIAFQYFTIKPMRGLSPWRGLVEAVKADTLSLTAWQVGMYGFMAIAHFVLFETLLGERLEVATAAFWFMMQIAMWCGFATAYPVNWWLVRAGIKEAM